MKNVILSFSVFIILIIAISFSIVYLNRVSSNLLKLDNTLEQSINDDNWDKAYKTSMEFTYKWETYSKTIKLFVDHEEIDNVEIELWKLPQYTKEHTKDEALASVHVLKFLLNHIINLEKVNIQNIF